VCKRALSPHCKRAISSECKRALSSQGKRAISSECKRALSSQGKRALSTHSSKRLKQRTKPYMPSTEPCVLSNELFYMRSKEPLYVRIRRALLRVYRAALWIYRAVSLYVRGKEHGSRFRIKREVLSKVSRFAGPKSLL